MKKNIKMQGLKSLNIQVFTNILKGCKILKPTYLRV